MASLGPLVLQLQSNSVYLSIERNLAVAMHCDRRAFLCAERMSCTLFCLCLFSALSYTASSYDNLFALKYP